jgi:hypothetical protein
MHFGICLPNSAVKIVKKIGYGRQREHFCENYDLNKNMSVDVQCFHYILLKRQYICHNII